MKIAIFLKELVMVLIPVICPHCDSDQVVKRGKTGEGKQRYRCGNESCNTKTFILDYSYNGYLPEVKKKGVTRCPRPREEEGVAL
jgi:transposase-like protein